MRETATEFVKVFLAQHLRFSLIGTPSHAEASYQIRRLFALKCPSGVQSRIMPFHVLGRFSKKFAGGILRTTLERWIDGMTLASIILWNFVFKPVPFWEGVEPCVWLLCGICAVHTISAAARTWREIKTQATVREVDSLLLDKSGKKTKTLVQEPQPRYFRVKLSGVLILVLGCLLLLSYLVRLLTVTSLRTYIYLVPTAELMECQRRAFFVKVRGPQILYNAEIIVKDNESGKIHSETYPEVDPSPRSEDIYFWFVPSSPWNEDYTVTITTRDSHSSQHLIARSIQHQLQFATQITLDNEKKPTWACRDTLLPASYVLAAGERKTCAGAMKLAEGMPDNLDVFSYQRADGSVTIRKMKVQPSPSELDELSEDRHITEYQQQIIEPILKKFGRSSILIYFAGGEKSKAYAKEFGNLFSRNNWMVKGPTMVPIGNERIIDIQLSVNYQENWNKSNPKSLGILGAFKRAGIKLRSRLVADPKVPNGLIVLWVGPKSPNNADPDHCSPPAVEYTPGEPQTCDMMLQGNCPFPPK